MKAKSFFLLVILLTGALCASATTYYVRCDGNDSDSGTTEGTAFLNLTKVFGLTLEAGDVIDIGEGTFGYHSNKGIAIDLTIKGAGKGLTVISGTLAGAKAKSRAFTIGASSSTPTVVIEDLTFKDYGVLEEDTAFADTGGVLYFSGPTDGGASLTCSRVDFVTSRAYRGGAVYIARGGTVRLEDCVFSGNAAVNKTSDTQPQGGAIFVSVGNYPFSMTIDRCLFENNTCPYRGSTMFLSVTNTTVDATVLVQNSTFTGNAITVSGGSGGIYNAPGGTSNAEFTYINNTFAYNTAVGTGTSGLIVGTNSSGKVTFINNIVFGHTGAGLSLGSGVTFKESRNNITDIASTTFNFTSKTQSGASSGNQSGVTATNLGLAESLADNGGQTKTLAIASNSVAKDVGYTTGAPALDQTGYTRQNPDVGAYEYRAKEPTPLSKHKKKDIKYSQEKGRVVFSEVKDFSKVSVFSASGQLLHTEALSSANFEYAAGKGIYVFLFEGDNKLEDRFKIKIK